MKTMIAYSSTHGSAEECACQLAQKFNEAEVINLKQHSVNPSNYDCVILGSSIYGGQVQREVRDYCKKYLGILLQKPLGIYFTCMTQDETELRQFLEYAFPAEIVDHLTTFCAVGGAVYFTKMNFLERSASRIFLNGFFKSKGLATRCDGKTDYVTLSQAKIEAFAEKMLGDGERETE